MSDVVKEVNEAKSGGKHIDTMAIDAEEKGKIFAGEKVIVNPINAKRLAGTDEKDAHNLDMESLAGPQDEVVPEKSSDAVTGGLGSTEVKQQWDTSGPKEGVEKDAYSTIPPKFSGQQVKSKGIPSSSEVPQQTDAGKDGI
jgi:hypothetical protein